MMVNKILIDGNRSGLPEHEIQTMISERLNVLAKVEKNCTTEVADWEDRSNQFWCEIFHASVETAALATPASTKVFVIHGLKDDVVPVEEAYSVYSKLVSVGRNAKITIYPEMDHNFFGNVIDLLEGLGKWVDEGLAPR